MKLSLNIPERLLALGLLPANGDFVTLKVVRDLQGSLSFTDDEITKYKVNQDKEIITWDLEATDHSKEIDFGEIGAKIMVDQLKEMDKEKKLTIKLMSLYEKFIPTE